MTRTVTGAQNRVSSGAGVLNEEGVSGDGASAEALGRELRTWAKELSEEPEGPLFFGRLGFTSDTEAGDHRGQRYHIGRRRVSEHPAAPPLVLDWRAPVSRAFYQANATEPQGVAVRRRFGWAPGSSGEPGDLTGFEDELLAQGGQSGTSAPSVGRILTEEIERPRVGPMRDIVATIQPEQDELVRAGLEESVCVQGAPGTGKTAVGLHRAAYLLYTHPRRLRRGGMLVLGPNRAFMSYIAEVLPALGEMDVRQYAVPDLLARHAVRAADTEAAERLKHDARMAVVLRRALYARVRPPLNSLAVPDGSYRWRVSAEELRTVLEQVRAQDPPYLVGRERLRARVVALIRAQAERRGGTPGNEWLRRTGRARPVTAVLDEAWPKVKPEEVVAQLLGDWETLSAAAEGVLSAGECETLLRPAPPRSVRSVRWTEADMVLLDEVAGLLERPEESWGHVVVDEAQDLSPMQCRAIARRTAHGSLTVLGDLAQGTTPWAASHWPDQLAHLGKPQTGVVPLTTGFRVPAAVIEAANRLLPALNSPVPAARSMRGDGELRIRQVPDLAAATVEAVREALAREGSIGVIAAAADLDAVRPVLAASGIATADAHEVREVHSTARVTALPATLAKGLEFDHVVLLEPASVVDAEVRGLHRLYVALTRAVSRLDVLHH
ncbi:MAG TPA: AAA family ATPase, partial [Streptomyces sp.]|nr:AAA family ATPase [Streptomyces sp.]